MNRRYKRPGRISSKKPGKSLLKLLEELDKKPTKVKRKPVPSSHRNIQPCIVGFDQEEEEDKDRIINDLYNQIVEQREQIIKLENDLKKQKQVNKRLSEELEKKHHVMVNI